MFRTTTFRCFSITVGLSAALGFGGLAVGSLKRNWEGSDFLIIVSMITCVLCTSIIVAWIWVCLREVVLTENDIRHGKVYHVGETHFFHDGKTDLIALLRKDGCKKMVLYRLKNKPPSPSFIANHTEHGLEMIRYEGDDSSGSTPSTPDADDDGAVEISGTTPV